MPKGQIPWNKGKKGIYSFEVLQKMSLERKCRIPWNKGKAGIYSEETLKKFSDIAKLRVGPKNPFYGRKQSLQNVLKHRGIASIPSIRMCLSCGRGFLKKGGEKFRYFARQKYCSPNCQNKSEAILKRRQHIFRLPYHLNLCLCGCDRPAVHHTGIEAANIFASQECYFKFRTRKALGCERCHGTQIWKECKCPERDIISHTVKYIRKDGKLAFKIRKYANRNHRRGLYPRAWKNEGTKRERIVRFRLWILRYYYRGLLQKPKTCQREGCNSPVYQLCPVDPKHRWERRPDMSLEDAMKCVIWTCYHCYVDLMEAAYI